MRRPLWDTLLNELRAVHNGHEALRDFAPFPDDLTPQHVTPFETPGAGFLARETELFTDRYTALRDAIIAAGPVAAWRETYKGSGIGQDFMDRFGCYCIIGDRGAFASASYHAFIVHLPPRLHYPWHHHPAEEIYLVLAGEARFFRKGTAAEVLRAGGTSQHASNQPHAMETDEHPVLALALWRNGFDTAPVLTPPDR